MRLAIALSLICSTAFAQPYERIASAGGSLTEIVVALGAGDRLVGVDSTSTYPQSVTELPGIGYVRALASEGLLTLEPDLVLGESDTGPQTVLDQLTAAGVKIAIAPHGEGAESVPLKMRFVGEHLGLVTEAEAMIAEYDAAMERIAASLQNATHKPRVLFILSMQNGAPIVGGEGSSADAMIKLAGGANAATGFEGFKPMNREAILAAAPEIILMMNGHADRLGGVDEVLSLPEIALTPAGQNKHAVTMDGMLLLGFGPRTPQAVRQLAKELHPEDADRLGL